MIVCCHYHSNVVQLEAMRRLIGAGIDAEKLEEVWTVTRSASCLHQAPCLHRVCTKHRVCTVSAPVCTKSAP